MIVETGRFEIFRPDIQAGVDVTVLSLKFRAGCQGENSDRVSMSLSQGRIPSFFSGKPVSPFNAFN